MCISYDALACQVWLDPISVAPAGGQPLCADHAQRLSAPRGWVILDRRTSQSTLMTAAGPAPAQDARGRAAVPRRRLPRAWGQFDAPRLEFLAEDDVVAEPDPTFEPPAAAVAPAEPDPTVEPPVPVELRAETVEFRQSEPEVAEPEPEPEPVVPEPEPEPELVEPGPVEPGPVVPEPEPAPVAKKAPARSRRAKAPETPGAKPKGRLLSRAFESAGPQRSAITESLDAAGVGTGPDTGVDAGIGRDMDTDHDATADAAEG